MTFKFTRLGPDGESLSKPVVIKGATEVHLTLDDTPAEEIPPFETFTMEFAIGQPDPDPLGLMTGGVTGTPLSADPTFAIEMVTYTPVRRRAWRVVWEWLTRAPRQYTQHHVYIPHARVSGNPTGDSDG